jgi:hypothetical protein
MINVPERVASASELSVEDLYGLEDAPAVLAVANQKGGRRPVDDRAPEPSRLGTRGTRKSGRSKVSSGKDSGPWGVPIRRAGCAFLFTSLIISRLLRRIPSEYQTNQVLAFCFYAAMGLVAVGVLLTLVSFVGAAISCVTGNRRAFASVSLGEGAGWAVACLIAPAVIIAFIYGYAHPTSALAQTIRSAGGARGAFPDGPPMPTLPPGAAALPGFGSPAQSDVRVTLSNGRFMRNTGLSGTARPGVEISVDYNVDSGAVAGPEHFVLVIKSARGRGELDNLHELQFRRSGTIRASSFMASPEEGPYEAWMEVASMPGPMGSRKQVSNTIPLQFTDVPVRDPAAEARAALEEQMRKMASPPPMPQNPGMRPQLPTLPRRGRLRP